MDHSSEKPSDRETQPAWIKKVKRVTLILTVIGALIAAVVKISENVATIGTIKKHNAQLQTDLDKVYKRTHDELQQYADRP